MPPTLRFACAVVITCAACSTTARDEQLGTVSDPSTGRDDPAPGPEGNKLDVGSDSDGPSAGDGGGGCAAPPPTGDATLTGTVYAPNGELPLSGALVWASEGAPEPIPDHVYCLDCVELPCDSPHAFTGPEGTFALELPAGTHHLVVQKGQFRRVTRVDVEPGVASVDAESTTLPGHHDPGAGLWIPRIAMAWGEYDRLEDALAKLGLADTVVGAGTEDFVPGSESFDVYINADGLQHPLETDAVGTFGELISDYDQLAQYHIIFVPCTSSPYSKRLRDDDVLDNLRRWVDAGGKLYVADWSNEFMERPFPQYQTWYEDAFLGGIDLDWFSSLATIEDDDLLAWLEALPGHLKDINPDNNSGPHPTLAQLPRIQLVDL